MAQPIRTSAVEDTVPKVNNEVAVGEDPAFQRRWWKFESFVWCIFVLLVVLDVAGAFGRGPLAKAQKSSNDGELNVTYERIERTGTPSSMKIKFGESAFQNGQVKLWTNEALVTDLGNKLVAPQPGTSTVGQDGIEYLFPVTTKPATVVFSLQPSAPGVFPLTIRTAHDELHFKILVMP